MAWTAPRTYSVSEFITAAILNTHVRDNLLFLKSDPVISEVTSTASLSDSSGNWTTVMTTGAVAIPADVGEVFVEVWARGFGYVGTPGSGGTMNWQVAILEATQGTLNITGPAYPEVGAVTAATEGSLMLPFYMRSREYAWAGTSRTVTVALLGTNTTTTLWGGADSPVVLRVVRAY